MDYSAIAQSRLTSQFAEKPLIKALAGAIVAPLQEIEAVANQLKEQRWIATAVGAQLDGAGYIVGESRAGRNDADYREAILFRIFVNTSNATPEDMIKALRYITKPDDIQYIEQYPATAMLFTDGPFVPKNIKSVIQDLAPAAISDLQILTSFSWKAPFRFGREGLPSELFVNGDADYLTGNGADLQVQAGEATTGSRLGGISPPDLFVGDFMLDVGGQSLVLNAPNFDTIIESGSHLTGVYV